MCKRFYLAYGSNLNIPQMQRRCPTAKIVGTAEIKDYELLFKGSKTGSYLTIEPKKGATVPVAVWRTLNTFAYIMDERRQLGAPNGYYINTCLNGYDSFGFDRELIFKAIDESLKAR